MYISYREISEFRRTPAGHLRGVRVGVDGDGGVHTYLLPRTTLHRTSSYLALRGPGPRVSALGLRASDENTRG